MEVCVGVLSIQRRVDVEQVATAIGMHKWFAVGSSSIDRCAWAASRVLHRSRLLMAPDGCCEAIGSWMRYQWNPRKHDTPQQVADGVFLAQAGVRCIGGQRDEVLIAEVTRILQETSSRKMQSAMPAAHKAMLQRHIAEHDQWVRDSGRSSYEGAGSSAPTSVLGAGSSAPNIDMPDLGNKARDRRAWLARRSRANDDLPAEMQRAVRQSVSTDGRMSALQLDVQHLHARQRGATSSVMRERVCHWLRSEAGQVWSKERAKMLRADDTDLEEG